MSWSETRGRKPESLRSAIQLRAERRVFPTGSASVDLLLGGGLRTGEMVEVYGASNTGKTQLGMQCAVSVASAGELCVYVDTEGQFRPERLSSMCEARGLDPGRVLRSVYLLRAESSQRQSLALGAIVRDRRLRRSGLVVVDTLTKNFSLELQGSKMVGRRQTVLGAYLNRLSRDAYLNDRAVLLLNRVASVVSGAGQEEVDIGGQTVRHFVQKVIHLRRDGQELHAVLAGEGREERTAITTAGLE